MKYSSAPEPLEARIAPAIAIVNQPFDIVAGLGQTGATVDLGKMVDDDFDSYRTQVKFTFNFSMPGSSDPAEIVIELFDDKAPVTVQNFLSYVNGTAGTDYNGTFIHRAGELNGSHAGADIIQGGGFDVSNYFKHIETATTVHNEFNADDPEVQNVRGTIAMAKTGIGPHTGSSEWFFNLTDNASTLGGTNNGGFTVFGKIVEGIEVADAIGAANLANLGGALSTLPVQETVSGTPKPAQLFQITNAEVDNLVANLNGHTFGNVRVKLPGTTSDSSLLEATLVGGQLNLQFAEGASGVAEVLVDVMKDGETTVTEKFLVTVKPNLLSEVTSHKLAQTFVPGDEGVAKVLVTNNSAGFASGNVKVRLYLSELKGDGNGDGLPDQPTFIKDAADVLIGEMTVPIDLTSGESLTVSVPYLVKDIANNVALIGGKGYLVLAEVVPAENASIDELFTDDNTGPRLTGHTYQAGFGDFNGRKNAVMTIETPTGLVTFKLNGSGSGTFTRDADGGIDVRLANTNSGSVLTVKAESGVANIDDLALTAFMGTVKLPNAVLHGDFTSEAGLKSVNIGSLGTAASEVDKAFSINGLPGGKQKVNATFGDVWNYSFTSLQPVGKLTATNWFDTANTAEDQIYATQVNALRVEGNLEANVLVVDNVKVGQIVVGGTLRNVTVKTAGEIGVIKLGNMTGSTILAGMNEIPDALADFSTLSAIGNLSVTGTMADSVVAAARFKSITLANVDKDAGTEVKGIYADAIKSYVRKGTSAIKLKNLDAAGTFDAADNYEVRVF